jgi:hypothetical protein
MPFSLTDVLLSPIERPRCGRCRTRMNLATIVPRANRSEERTFQCPKCDLIEIKVVTDPLTSEQAHRLADGVRPPA